MFYFLHTHTKTKTKNRLYINETAVVFSDCGRFIMNSVYIPYKKRPKCKPLGNFELNFSCYLITGESLIDYI